MVCSNGELGIRITQFIYGINKSDLVYEVEGHSSLSNVHLPRLRILKVLLPNAIHMRLKLASNLKFLPIFFTLIYI